MPEELMVLRSFADEFEAESARAALDACGIPAMLRSDAATVHPSARYTEGIELIVRQSDAEAARQILDAGAGEPE